jgi:branched-chain amino acid transport system ATP-binding protein
VSELLRGESLSRHFGGLKAVDEVDFELNEGEILGLIGPNGAGKTTLFSVIAGSIPPSSGHVLLEDRQITGWPAHRAVHAGICRTHQIVRPFAKMTVLENVLVGSRYGKPRRIKAGVVRQEGLELLELMGLRDRAAGLPGELTLAGRKRLEMARALATGPRVLLLDEVVAGLNPTEARDLSQLIGRIRERGITIIMIEHVMQAVMGLSDRVMVLDEGKKIAEGSPEVVANDHKVIEAYLGTETPAHRGGMQRAPDHSYNTPDASKPKADEVDANPDDGEGNRARA